MHIYLHQCSTSEIILTSCCNMHPKKILVLKISTWQQHRFSANIICFVPNPWLLICKENNYKVLHHGISSWIPVFLAVKIIWTFSLVILASSYYPSISLRGSTERTEAIIRLVNNYQNVWCGEKLIILSLIKYETINVLSARSLTYNPLAHCSQ
jgi:hypothetical protein